MATPKKSLSGSAPIGRNNGSKTTSSTNSTSSLQTKSSSSSSSDGGMLVSLRTRRVGSHCPFGNASIEFSLATGGCVWLKGASGRGKTTTALYLADLVPLRLLQKLDMSVDQLQWDENIPLNERCGVLFQQTTLLDELTVAGNLALALRQHDAAGAQKKNPGQQQQLIKQWLDTVGLRYERDANKRVNELSGGMGRRASLALQLAQRKRVIVLDEPFAGLDHESATAIAKELVHLRQMGTALILIAHEWDLAALVLAEHVPECRATNVIVEFEEPSSSSSRHEQQDNGDYGKAQQPNLFGIRFRDRFLERLLDYVGYSLPLILLTFTACGMAIAMLSCDTLRRIDITQQVLKIVDQEVRPLIKMLTGTDATPFHMMGVNMKVKSMLNASIPPAKAALFATGLTKLFVLEIGPLLTALLLCGRIGGSYAGRVATLRATQQWQLLRVLEVSPTVWSLLPSAAAAVLAGPLLTVTGTTLALILGGHVSHYYGIVHSIEKYWEQVRMTLWPEWRLTGWLVTYYHDYMYQYERAVLGTATAKMVAPTETETSVLLRSTFSPFFRDTVIEIVTYPPVYHVVKAITFTVIILGTAEVCARYRHAVLTPRHVPSVITTAVVTAGLLVILADWGFSRLWLQRR